jgi:general secretion pathway protein G
MLLTIRNTQQKATRRAAFTLLEVLVVVAILVILAGVASISVFRYMEDAKVGRAKADMRTIEQAYKKFYTDYQEWPQNISQIAPFLEQGEAGLYDPWKQMYRAQMVEYQDQTDGTTRQRPLLECQPPGNKPLIQVPDPNTNR